MSKPNPSKRRSIRDKDLIDETDDVVSGTRFTRSKTSEKLQKVINGDRSDDNGLSELSSDGEELFYELQQARRRSSSGDYEAQIRARNQQKRNASSDNEIFDSSPSPPRDENIELELKKKSMKPQVKNKIKSSRSSGFDDTYTLSNNNSGCSITFWVTIFVVVVLALGALYSYQDDFDTDGGSNINVLKCNKDDVKCITDDVKRTLKSMKAKYTNQDANLWSDVFVGIKNIIHDPKRPSIIVLLGDKTDPLECLAVLLGNVSSNALNSGLLQLTPENFENDMGSVITSLRSSIKDKKAVIVWDLLNINEEALKAFHNLCDRINPLVEEVIYIITIIADDDYDKKMEPLEYVEKKLYKKLSGKIKEDTIQPLITRITDGPVLSVRPEPDIIDCPLPKLSN